jgi:membrane fusion protein, multidrug efflux system
MLGKFIMFSQACRTVRSVCLFACVFLLQGTDQSSAADTSQPPVEFPGQIEVLNSHEVSNLIDGIITEVHFEPGEFVEAGEILFSIEADRYERAVKTRRLSTVQAETALTTARQDLERIRKLKDRGSATDVQLLKAEAALSVGEALLEQAKAELKSAEISLENTTIRAPLSGVIGRSAVNPGTYVETGRAPLARIDQMDPVRLSYKFPYVERIEELGIDDLRAPSDLLKKVTLQIKLSETWIYSETTTPERVSSRVDTSDGTLTIWAELANPKSQLRPGMRVTVVPVLKDER